MERKLSFGESLRVLNKRDRAILVLLLNRQSTAAVASFFNTLCGCSQGDAASERSSLYRSGR